MKLFLALLPNHDNKLTLTRKIDLCEAKRSPLIRAQWSHTNDLLISIGSLEAEQASLRSIVLALASISEVRPFMATVGDIRLYGNAVVLSMEPYQQFLKIHKSMDLKLSQATQPTCQFFSKGRFDPYMVLGRIPNLRDINPAHKQQFMTLLDTQLKGFSFLIQQAALMIKLPEPSSIAFKTIQLYNLQR